MHSGACFMWGGYNSVIAYFAPRIDHYLGKNGSENCKFICETCEAGLKTVIKSHYCTASWAFSGQPPCQNTIEVKLQFWMLLQPTELHSNNPNTLLDAKEHLQTDPWYRISGGPCFSQWVSTVCAIFNGSKCKIVLIVSKDSVLGELNLPSFESLVAGWWWCWY